MMNNPIYGMGSERAGVCWTLDSTCFFSLLHCYRFRRDPSGARFIHRAMYTYITRTNKLTSVLKSDTTINATIMRRNATDWLIGPLSRKHFSVQVWMIDDELLLSSWLPCLICWNVVRCHITLSFGATRFFSPHWAIVHALKLTMIIRKIRIFDSVW